MNNEKHPIIGQGELYIEPIQKKSGFGKKQIPHEYSEAKERIFRNIETIQSVINEQKEIFLRDKVVCVRMEPKFEAKSYVPDNLVVSDNMKIIGGRKYSYLDESGDEVSAKLYFLKTDDEGLVKLKRTLSSGEKDEVENWRKQVGSIKTIDLLLSKEKLFGIENDWDIGNVEIVIHPLGKSEDDAIEKFFETSGLKREKTYVKSYEDGLTFISAKCNKKEIENISKFNPLRTLHPLGEIDIDFTRSVIEFEAPNPRECREKSSVLVGVFDGGVDETIPLLNGYVKNVEKIETEATNKFLSHGVGVCGAILYGELANTTKKSKLEIPTVSIESFRVLPIEKTDDPESAQEMYKTIDAIEEVVKSRKDIRLFNLSLGPKGAIFDDSISRFTYVMDKLTYEVGEGEVNPLFCIAVGNDGELEEPLNRIQAPSDMVNGLAVGAYMYANSGEKMCADYSCIGPGREGAKVKPDLLEYGGSNTRPFVKVGLKHNTLSFTAGTSMATPLATGKIGRLMAKSSNIVPHLGRTLLIHNAENETTIGKVESGHGFSTDDINSILECDDKRVTVLYSGVLGARNTVKLPIFAPNINSAKGKVNITWTITTIVPPCAADLDAYTNNCIEDTFVPHDLTFNFTKKGFPTKKLNLAKPENSVIAAELLSKGYKRSDLPVASSAKKSFEENDLRNKDFKWDTVIKKEKNMLASSLLNPFITMHAIGRNGYEDKEIKYFVAVTIEVPKYQGSLYDNILQSYENLLPIEIRNTNRIMVPIE